MPDRYVFEVEISPELLAQVPQELREYAAPMREIFRDLQEKCSWIAVTYR